MVHELKLTGKIDKILHIKINNKYLKRVWWCGSDLDSVKYNALWN